MIFADQQSPLVIWRLLDGKPGHESQTLGLTQALSRRCGQLGRPAPRVIDLPLAGRRLTLLDWLFRRFRPGFLQPRPDLILGAGHRTHWALLCARHAFGGRTVALMTPSLPRSWFDVVVSPRHDEVAGGNVIETVGVLNPMQPGIKRPGYTLVLVGGISKHFHWRNDDILSQIEAIMARHPQVCLTDSRRTPPELRAMLAERWPVVYQPWDACPPGWLANELAIADNAWVSEDSVSMIYEALTAGCETGLISLDAANEGRLARGIQQLEAEGRVRRLNTPWRMAGDQPPLQEAARVAACLLPEADA